MVNKMTPASLTIVFSAALVILLSMGARNSFGLFQTPISEAFGIGLTAFSFSLALQNLLWGFSQPFVGALADKYGSGRVIAIAGAAPSNARSTRRRRHHHRVRCWRPACTP